MAELNAGNDVNKAGANVKHSHSSFDELSRVHYRTMRFADITPIMFMNTVKTDKIPYRSDHDLRTLSLSSPIMSNLKLKKAFFNVPMECILPLNWEKIYINPVIGDDVPQDAYTAVNLSSLSVKFRTFFSELLAVEEWTNTELLHLIQYLVFFEYFYSAGSLLNYSGVKMHACFRWFGTSMSIGNSVMSYDKLFDACFQAIRNCIGNFTLYRNSSVPEYHVYSDYDPNALYVGNKVVSYHTMLEDIRDNCFILNIVHNGDLSALRQRIIDIFGSSLSNVDIHSVEKPIDISRLWAYQIVCAHYFSNDHVDYIYSAELFRQLVGNYIQQVFSVEYFNCNDIVYHYDYLSAHNFNRFIDNFFNLSNPSVCAFFSNLFSFNRSLKYKDYFTGGRTNPLAVGDVNIPVQSNDTVSVIDVTRKIQSQRFLNAINRSGRKFSSYLENLFGGNDVGYDYHNPAYLGTTEDNCGAYETQNTGEAQQLSSQSITSNIRNASGKFCFEFNSDRPSILVGVAYFDIRRAYANASDRLCFVKDRFDMFNPMMQYIGDQEIFGAERYLPDSGTFGYTLRNMEYKQSFDTLEGGFVSYLPTWCFRAHDGSNPVGLHLSPDFIRSKNDELDSFYTEEGPVLNYSLGGYFHFIVQLFNDFGIVKRPMVYAPTVL